MIFVVYLKHISITKLKDMPRNMSFKPLGTRILIAPCKEEKKNQFGLIIPDKALKKEPPYGIIKAKGEGNKFNSMDDVIIGNRVRFKSGSGTEQEVNEVMYLIIDYSDGLYFE
jgi:co-chaperonin GroES (HSP10)